MRTRWRRCIRGCKKLYLKAVPGRCSDLPPQTESLAVCFCLCFVKTAFQENKLQQVHTESLSGFCLGRWILCCGCLQLNQGRTLRYSMSRFRVLTEKIKSFPRSHKSPALLKVNLILFYREALLFPNRKSTNK